MKLLMISFYNDYYFHEISEFKYYYVRTFYYKSEELEDSFFDEVESKLIMTRGDNIRTSIKYFGDICIIDVSLIYRFVEDYDEQKNDYSLPDEQYLSLMKDWFDTQLEEADASDIRDSFSSFTNVEQGIYISIQKAEYTDLLEIVSRELEQCNGDYQILKTDRFTYNAGAGSIGEAVLVWVSQKIGDLAFEKLKNRFTNNDISTVETTGLEKIYDYLEANCHVSRINLRVIEAEKLDNGNSRLTLCTYYQDFVVTYNKKDEVIDLHVIERTQTRI